MDLFRSKESKQITEETDRRLPEQLAIQRAQQHFTQREIRAAQARERLDSDYGSLRLGRHKN